METFTFHSEHEIKANNKNEAREKLGKILEKGCINDAWDWLLGEKKSNPLEPVLNECLKSLEGLSTGGYAAHELEFFIETIVENLKEAIGKGKRNPLIDPLTHCLTLLIDVKKWLGQLEHVEFHRSIEIVIDEAKKAIEPFIHE